MTKLVEIEELDTEAGRWVIECINDHSLYWNNLTGWQDRDQATLFSDVSAIRCTCRSKGRGNSSCICKPD
jgi:hypothetical protein